MRRRIVIGIAAGLLALGGGSAFAQGPGNSNGKGPDANGPAKAGLCTAYFNGKGGENGKKNEAPPFRNLADAAEAADKPIEEFCEGLVRGNPSFNGDG